MRVRPTDRWLVRLLIKIWLGLLAIGIVLMVATLACADTADDAQRILRAHCYSCHGGEKRESDPNYDVTDLTYMLDPTTSLIVAGDPDASRVMQRIETGEMPPEDKPQLSTEEIATLRQWIADGAPHAAHDRALIDDKYTSAMIGMDAFGMGRREAMNFRYLSLANLYNDGASASELETVHAAIHKAMNGLSFQPQAHEPVVLDELGLVVRIDLRDYGWTATDWQQVVDTYPYRVIAQNVLRADAFLWLVTRAPLYYELLDTPTTELALERKLGVDRDANSVRAGVTHSEVAAHNRIFVRREGDFGYYWKALNVLDSGDGKDILVNPIGFDRDYVVALYSLPNQYLAYAAFINDQDRINGRRVDDVDARAEIDPDQLGGTPSPRVAASCIGCHTSGIQPNIRDVVRDGAVGSLDTLSAVRRMFPPQDELTSILAQDRQRFLDVHPPIEPLKPTILRYNRPLTLRRAAIEVGAEDNALANLIRNNRALQAMGLRPLLEGRTVTRRDWQNGPAKRVAQLLKEN